MLVADQIEDPEENARVCERIDTLEEVMSLRERADCGCGCFIH